MSCMPLPSPVVVAFRLDSFLSRALESFPLPVDVGRVMGPMADHPSHVAATGCVVLLTVADVVRAATLVVAVVPGLTRSGH